jgi:hypothetical protein
MQNNGLASFQEARAQATECLGFVASKEIRVGNEVFEIPNASLLDDEQQMRVDALDLEVDGYDRHPDVLNADGSVKVRGALMVPYRKNGKLVENYNIRLAKAIFGERFEKFRAAGGRSNDVALFWSQMRQEMDERRKKDSKSSGSVNALALVPDSD